MLLGLGKEIDELISGRAEIAYSVRRRQGTDMEKYTAGTPVHTQTHFNGPFVRALLHDFYLQNSTQLVEGLDPLARQFINLGLLLTLGIMMFADGEINVLRLPQINVQA